MAPKFKALTVAVGALLALAGSGVAHAAAAPAAADATGMEAIFNNPPENGDRDHSIETRLVQLTDGTPAGAEIHISLFSWTRPALAEAIKAAQARGVKVRIALDGAADDDPANTAMPILKSAGLTSWSSAAPAATTPGASPTTAARTRSTTTSCGCSPRPRARRTSSSSARTT